MVTFISNRHFYSSQSWKAIASGLIKDLLRSLKSRLRQDFLDKYTKKKKGTRHLVIDNKHIIEATEAKQQKIRNLISNWQKYTQKDANFYQVLDVQQRIAGTGSLG
ncbi:MAG: DUF2252 family protein, partial [Nostoc sp.]|uniref:DUF2252 family protein n=1 Tax=Nostoc sp. TaxID=1180 RepID=UPI002FFA64AA